MYAALEAATAGARVVLVTKGSLRASNSFYAQGGIAAAIGPDDHPALHMEDTIRAGRGLSNPAAVRVLASEAAGRIADLRRHGVHFDTTPDGRTALAREGGHRRRRILHAGGSATGAHIAETLIARLSGHPNIEVIEQTGVVGLIAEGGTCDGAWVLGHDELRPIRARMTLVATGGAGALYERTTNPPGALGDGIALARAAGADVNGMEFVQFHPTALAVGERAFLISEAVRGEGAHLVDGDGDRFMVGRHADAELAPRDVVAREIQQRLSEGRPSFLSLQHLDPGHVRRAFPNLVAGAAAVGIDLTADLVPVAPAAHYLMGGIATDLSGATSIAGLYAAGECASSGVHGANRLASNSLLECFVFAHRAVAAGLDRDPEPVDAPLPEQPVGRVPLGELRRRMWREAGPLRDAAGLTALLAWIDDQPLSTTATVARMIAACALARRETRGAHVRTDHPAEDPALCHQLPCPELPSIV